MIKEVLEKLRSDMPKLAPLRVWQAYAHLEDYKGSTPANELTALVALIRRVCGLDSAIAPYAETVRKNFKSWIMKKHSGSAPKFTEEQVEWLRMIRDHVIQSFHIEREDLDMAPFDARGGLGRMHQLFGDSTDSVLEDLNDNLGA